MKAARLLIIACLAIMATLQACSLKKNTAASRNYMAFITRYNIYFNGDEHFKETLKDLEGKYEDDYSQILYMHPAEAYANEKAPQPQGDFKRSIEKAQKAIQLRSIKKRPRRKPGKGNDPEYKKWLQREEYNPFLHNAWMMMARSQYFGGDYFGAASTFYYIAKHFWWLPATVTEAKLWQARCYCAVDWLFEAESILVKIKQKELQDNASLEYLYQFTYADLYIRSKEYEKSIPYLKYAADHSKGAQKARLTFLLGQMYERTGKPELAYRAFKKVGGMSSVSYRTKFNSRIKQSEVFQGADITSEVKALKTMARYGSNREFLDQIYYAIGNLYLSRGDTIQAMDNYRKAVETSTRNGIDKAIAQITLGALYFNQGDYDKAQPCYAEAVPLLPDNTPDYAMLKRRSDVLDELAVYSQNVTLQDSLLKLADMSPEQQREVVDKIIADLKKREQEEAEAARREEYLAQQAAAGTGLQQGSTQAPSTFTLNTDKSWYFYNQATRNAGRTEFQKRWGSRRLEDDWRRRNKAVFSTSGEFPDSQDDQYENPDSIADDNGDGTDIDQEAREHASDPHYPEYYLRQIPSTPAERTTANDVIQEGLYNMGIILKDKLEDYKAATHEFDRLQQRYPDNVYRLDVYYNMYLMCVLQNDTAGAEHYRSLILREFPESKYGEALADPQYMDKLMRMPQVEEQLYREAYDAYMANDNRTVHRICTEARKDYPMSRIMPKFLFLNALSYVTENNPEEFSALLSELTERYPDADVSPLASSYLKLLSQGRKFNTSQGNVRGMVWSTRLSNDTSAVSMDNAPAQFDFESDGPQLLVLIYSASRVNANSLLFDVARHNFSTYVVRDFELEQMQFGDLGLLIVSGFDNIAELNHYREDLEKGGKFRIPKGVVPLMISRHNFDILLNEGRTLEEYFVAAGDNRLSQIHEATLPPDQYPSASEMYSPENTVGTSTGPQTPAAPAAAETTEATEKQTPVTQQPAPQHPEPTAPVQPSPDTDTPATKAEQEPDDDDFYDIPIPPVPTGRPPVAPRL